MKSIYFNMFYMALAGLSMIKKNEIYNAGQKHAAWFLILFALSKTISIFSYQASASKNESET